jgi:hypothetical protein
VVGVLGLWRENEPPCEPCERALLSPPVQSPRIVTGFARVGADTLTLDLGNSVPEITQDGQKAKLGPLSLSAVAADMTTTALGTLTEAQYAQAAYEAAAGIATLPLTAAQAAAAQAGDLQMTSAAGDVILKEMALRAVPLTPNVYTDISAPAAVQLQVQVLDRGVPAGQGIDVRRASYGDVAPVSETVQTNADGIATFSIGGVVYGSIEGFYLMAGPSPEDLGGIVPSRTTYFYVRTLGDTDDYTKFPATWENVYSYVLSNWQAMAPCMDNWLNLGDPDQVRAMAPMIKRLTDPANIEAFRFMPVTRDMTAAKRDLLWRFLDGPSPPAAVVATDSEVAPEVSLPLAQARLSRALRGH